jgi:hypothetical protein
MGFDVGLVWGAVVGRDAGGLRAGWVGDFGLGLFGGPAWKTGAASQPFELGMGVDASVYRMHGGRIAIGPAVEGGFYHPAFSGTGNYYASVDAMIARGEWGEAWAAGRLRPFAAVGYTRFFNATKDALTQEDAMNFGVGVDRALSEDLWLRVEVREHYTPDSDTHALVLRIGIVGVESLR